MSRSEASVLGFHHPGVVVPDLNRAIDFYCQLLGFELYSESSWETTSEGFNQVVGLSSSAARFCMLKGPNSFLELFEYRTPPSTTEPQEFHANELGIRHLAFAVTDVKKVLDRCIELGGRKINDPFSVPGGATSVYCRDPFGNLLELVKPGGRMPSMMGDERHE